MLHAHCGSILHRSCDLFCYFWLPEYLRKERGFDLAMVGKYAWVPYLFGDVGYMLGGWLSGRLMQAGWSLPKARKGVMLMGACCMPVAILAPLVPKAWMAIAATCFVTFGHAFWVSNIQAIPTDLFKSGDMGTATGFSGMGGAVGGSSRTWDRVPRDALFLRAGVSHGRTDAPARDGFWSSECSGQLLQKRFAIASRQ